MPNFGTDLSCTFDVSAEGRTVSGVMCLVEALIRRWTTPRGMLLGAPDYGTDVTENMNETVDELALERIRAELRSEALKDERVHDLSVIESSSLDDVIKSRVFRAVLSIDTADGPFTFTIGVSELSVELLGLEAAA